MGAQNIEFTINKAATQKQIEQAFKRQQREDKAMNGHREGYSGDFQTVNRVIYSDRCFPDFNTAHDFCLEHAQKWENVISVYYLKEKPKESKTLEKLRAKQKEIEEKIKAEEKRILEKAAKVKKNLATLVAGWGAC